MTSNTRLLQLGCATAFALFALVPDHAQAGGSATAPAMYNVEEVVVQPIHFGDPKIAKTCSLSQDEIGAVVLKTLRDNGVPANSSLEAKPPVQGLARINLVTDIFSLNSQGLDCTSWISLTAETHNSVHVPPVDLARNVAVVYWHEGSMLASGQVIHDRLVDETITKLARHLADQYKADQPAAVSDK